MGLGFAYDNSGQYDQAIHAYHETVRLKPAWAGTWNNLALAASDADAWGSLGVAYGESR